MLGCGGFFFLKALLCSFRACLFFSFLAAQWGSSPPVDRPSGLDPGCSCLCGLCPGPFVRMQMWPPLKGRAPAVYSPSNAEFLLNTVPHFVESSGDGPLGLLILRVMSPSNPWFDGCKTYSVLEMQGITPLISYKVYLSLVVRYQNVFKVIVFQRHKRFSMYARSGIVQFSKNNTQITNAEISTSKDSTPVPPHPPASQSPSPPPPPTPQNPTPPPPSSPHAPSPSPNNPPRSHSPPSHSPIAVPKPY